MVNKDRIVPITKTDYLSLIATVLTLSGETFDLLPADDVEGNFTISTDGTYLLNEPAKSINFEDDGTALFVPAFGFEGVMVNGVLQETDPVLDGTATLYSAANSSGTVTLSAVTPIIE